MPHRLRARALANVAGYRFGSGPELGRNFTRIQLWLALLQRELCIQLPAAAAAAAAAAVLGRGGACNPHERRRQCHVRPAPCDTAHRLRIPQFPK